MTIDALIPSLRELSRTEKLRAIQFLAYELEKDETLMLQPGRNMKSGRLMMPTKQPVSCSNCWTK